MIPTENRGKEYERISSKAELRAAKDFILNEFDFDSDVELDVAKSFKRKAGEFNPVKGKVRISKYLLDNHPEKVFRTLKHELAHAEVSENSERSKPHGKE